MMGVSADIHIGAYLEVQVKGEEKEIIISKTCPSCYADYSIYKDDKYCKHCGKLLEIDHTKQMEYPDLFDLTDGHKEIEENLQDPFADYKSSQTQRLKRLIGNLRSSEDKPYDDSLIDLETKTMEIFSQTIETYINNFKEIYSKVIEFLENHELVEKAEVKFGAFVYYS